RRAGTGSAAGWTLAGGAARPRGSRGGAARRRAHRGRVPGAAAPDPVGAGPLAGPAAGPATGTAGATPRGPPRAHAPRLAGLAAHLAERPEGKDGRRR